MDEVRAVDLCICVPVRDERERLPALFAALARQVGGGEWAVCLHLDHCIDDSEAVARKLADEVSFPVVLAVSRSTGAPNAGRARRAAMALGERRLCARRAGVLLATDADSAPAPDWVARARHALSQADVVCGRMVREGGAASAAQDRLEAYYDRLYALRRRLDPLPWEPPPVHHFTGGANLGFRADVYAGLGGFRERPSGEDALIVDEAVRAGFRVRRDARLVVETSSRRQGRAPDGLATLLQALDHHGADRIRVSDPADEAWRYAAQATARRGFEQGLDPGALRRLAKLLGSSAPELAKLARASRNAEAFAAQAVPACPERRPELSLAGAEAALAKLEAEMEGFAA